MKKSTATQETKLITSYEEACAVKGYDPAVILPTVSTFPEKHRAALIANAKLIVIAEVLNDGWEPDWDDDDEYKYYPWFWLDSPGFRFYDAGYDFSSTNSTGGSRLCFRTRKLAEHAGQTFLELYRDLMVIPKK